MPSTTLMNWTRLALTKRLVPPVSRLSTTVHAPPSSTVSPPGQTLGQTPPSNKQPSNAAGPVLALLGLLGGGMAYYSYATTTTTETKDTKDYQKVYNSIASILDNVDHDDGSLGPILLRLSWHAAGTYDSATGSGGSHGATMRFTPESAHGANAGLSMAREVLEGVKKKYSWLSYADLWSLAGVVAVQEMGGPVIPWRPGRKDASSGKECTPDGRLPDASKGASHLRDIFHRMGLTDKDIVALSGAHALGRCHPDRSGFQGPWTNSPTTFSNAYYKELLGQKWVQKAWNGPKQYVDKATGSLMMLPSDLALLSDKTFKALVMEYAADETLFYKDFAQAFQKLQELGVPFEEHTEPLVLQVLP